MVNVKNLFGMAVMASALVACSSNDDVTNPNPEQNGVASYAAFKINLPQVSGTRAASDVENNPGTTDEWKVNDATFLIFKNTGSNEADYTFVESSKVDLQGEWANGSGGITASKQLVAKLNSISKGGKYSVLVVLNAPTDFQAPSVGQTYGAWNNTVLTPTNVSAWTTNGFYMTNATLAVGAATQTLTAINDNNIYATAAAAAASDATAADVYVERGVAKVTVKQPGDEIQVKDKATGNGIDDKVSFSNWKLDVTNKKTYAVHNVTGLTTSWTGIWSSERMTGSQNRVFWGIDPNYNNNDLKDKSKGTLRSENFNFITNSDVDGQFADNTDENKANPQYCFENTFNLENMYQGQTTRVVFKATYTPATNHADADGTFYRLGTATANLTTSELQSMIETAAKAELGSVSITVDMGSLKNGGVNFVGLDNIKVNETALTADGEYNGKKGSAIVDAINTRLGLSKSAYSEDNVGINTYAKGVTYYIARVRHFSNTYCPWTSGQGYDLNENFLGRYGMLRNNWYELEIGNVYGPGYPSVPPTTPDTPDDENENYLSVSVKILDWAKRAYSVDL